MPKDEDIQVQFYVDNIDIPHWFILGWESEDEEK
jgi:hypothetical protein